MSRIRVLQWATGNVGRNAIEGVLGRDDLELVGARVHGADKVGRDVGELCGIDPVGVPAVGTLDEVIGLAPDCVVYAPMLADHDEIRALLRAGIDVVTPVGWFHVGDSPAVAETQAACLEGGATLHGTGIHPGGITEQLPLVISGFCRDIRHVRAEEFSDIRTYATEFVVREVMLFGKAPEDAVDSPMARSRSRRPRGSAGSSTPRCARATTSPWPPRRSTPRSASSRPARSPRSDSSGRARWEGCRA